MFRLWSLASGARQHGTQVNPNVPALIDKHTTSIAVGSTVGLAFVTAGLGAFAWWLDDKNKKLNQELKETQKKAEESQQSGPKEIATWVGMGVVGTVLLQKMLDLWWHSSAGSNSGNSGPSSPGGGADIAAPSAAPTPRH